MQDDELEEGHHHDDGQEVAQAAGGEAKEGKKLLSHKIVCFGVIAAYLTRSSLRLLRLAPLVHQRSA
ncbi:MAG: hypothetical protein Kow006_32590 [Gammaproteobacteria bacterium]